MCRGSVNIVVDLLSYRKRGTMKLETLKFGLLVVDMVLLSINIALELKKKRSGK
jgi:hypothetical protein